MNPNDDVLRRLFDTCNEIPMDGMPRFSRHEKMLLRSSERKDLFREKYVLALSRQAPEQNTPDIGASPLRPDRVETGVIQSVFDRDREREKRGFVDKEVRTLPKDTHWFETKVTFENIKVPIRIPMTTFNEDVGEVSLRSCDGRLWLIFGVVFDC